MKVRDSGMPEEGYWESLFDVPLILDRLQIDGSLADVVELGCGYGTFSLPVARRISGILTTFDVEEEMLARTRTRAGAAGIGNLRGERRDVAAQGFFVPPASQDACLLFNILHGEDPVGLLAEGARVVRTGGVVLAIHWRSDLETPRGPSLDIRPRPEQIGAWAAATGQLSVITPFIALPPWHFGVRLQRSADGA